MIKVDKILLNNLTEAARNSKRKRINYNFHNESSDPLQRMLNVMEPDTYICPHKHVTPIKRESFWCLQGEIAVLEFDDNGEIVDSFILNPLQGKFGCEIELSSWHTIIALTPNSVAYEVKDGPYNPDSDKIFAQWAPLEEDVNAQIYLKNLKEKILR